MAQVVSKGVERRPWGWAGLALCFFLWNPIVPCEAVVDRVVAIVNQEIITLSELQKWAGPLKDEIQAEDRLGRRQQIHEISRKVLDQLIEERLIDQEVKKLGIKIPGKEVEAALEEIRRRNNLTPEEFDKALAREGLTLETLKKQVEKKLQRTRYIQWNVKVDPIPSERELKDFYQKTKDRYRTNESYRPSHILFVVPREATHEEIREIRKKCQKVWEKVKAGEDFGEMALLHSEDASAKDRGDLGFFKKGELIPAFEKEALRLQVGEVSPIIRTDFGFHIIKLLERKGGIPPPLEEIRERILMDYRQQEMEKAYGQAIQKLKERSIIEIQL